MKNILEQIQEAFKNKDAQSFYNWYYDNVSSVPHKEKEPDKMQDIHKLMLQNQLCIMWSVLVDEECSETKKELTAQIYLTEEMIDKLNK